MTAEALEERIAAYCQRYKVRRPAPTGLPPYPAGERETRQHRDWVVLYKAITRFRRRQDGSPPPERVAALARQKGRCAICLAEIGGEGVVAHQPGPGGSMTIVHPGCNELIGLAVKLGPDALARLRSYLWPDVPSSSKAGRTR